EARELVRGRANGANRLVVVHAYGTEQSDRPERAIREAIAGGDQRHVLERRVLELAADADDGALCVERLVHELEERRTLLERLEQAPVDAKLFRTHVLEQAGGAPDVEPLLRPEQLRECRTQPSQELALARGEAGILEPPPEEVRPEAEARDALVEVLRSPFREPLIDRLVEGHHPLRHAA